MYIQTIRVDFATFEGCFLTDLNKNSSKSLKLFVYTYDYIFVNFIENYCLTSRRRYGIVITVRNDLSQYRSE